MDTSSLMEQILSKENLNEAYLQVVRNKGAAGVDGMSVEELGPYLSENGENIREQMRTRKYKPQPVRRVEIPKPDGGVRNLGVPTVVDRFVQQAVAQVLSPIFEEQFHDHSYGFRPNRCAQQAVLKALEMMNDGHNWIVDIDLAKFFDTVDHDKLMTIFGRTIKDGDVISLVRKIDCANKTEVRGETGKSGVFYLALAEQGLWKLRYDRETEENGAEEKITVKRLSGEGDTVFCVGLGVGRPGGDYYTEEKALYVSGRIGGHYGFYRTLDEGRTFERLNTDRQQFGEIHSIDGDCRVFGRFFLATGSNGVLYGEPKEQENRKG